MSEEVRNGLMKQRRKAREKNKELQQENQQLEEKVNQLETSIDTKDSELLQLKEELRQLKTNRDEAIEILNFRSHSNDIELNMLHNLRMMNKAIEILKGSDE